jgi:hypothetical protein
VLTRGTERPEREGGNRAREKPGRANWSAWRGGRGEEARGREGEWAGMAHVGRRGVKERKEWAADWEGWAAPFLYFSKLTQINLNPNEI